MRGFLRGLAWALGAVVIIAAAALLAVAVLGPRDGRPTVETAAATGPVCPPPIATPARAPGQPFDEIYGLRPALTLAEAESLLLCLDPGFDLLHEPYWHTLQGASVKGRKQMLHADRPGERVSLGLVGAMGEERVAALWRAASFPAEAAPLVSEVETELRAAYGPPHWSEVTPLRREFGWAFDPTGRPVEQVSGEASKDMLKQLQGWVGGGPNEAACLKQARYSPLDRPDAGAGCGLTVRALVEGRVEDATRAASLKLAVLDQPRLAAGMQAERDAAEARQ